VTRVYSERGYGDEPAAVKVKFTVDEFKAKSDTPIGIYFRAETDVSGSIVSLEVLYSKNPAYDGELVAYVVENLEARNTVNWGTATAFYGYFGLGGPELKPWYLVVSGGTELK